jgi:Domain of unknown function (DUF4157)
VTDEDEGVVPLGRRLDVLARARAHALAPRPAWAAPLAVALRHTAAVADVLGERFERTETPPRARAQLPVQQADLLAKRGVVPGTRAGGQRPGRPARDRSGPDGGPISVASPAEPWLPEEEQKNEAPDADVREIPADVRSRLRREVGPAADLMRVHDGPQADAHARAADADALTLGSDVYLRQGRWVPRRDEGVALLAHEATHVASLIDPGEAWHRAVGGEAEETLARARERSLLGARPGPFPTAPVGGGLPDVLGPLAAASRTAPAQGASTSPAAMSYPGNAAPAPSAPPPGATVPASARRAGVERDLTTSPAPAPDLDALRRGVIAEVMQRLRSEIERGA